MVPGPRCADCGGITAQILDLSSDRTTALYCPICRRYRRVRIEPGGRAVAVA